MSDIVERLRELAGETGTFGGDALLFEEAADEITRLQAENGERRKAQPYVYIGKDGKSVLARDLEDRLLKAEAELSSLKASAKDARAEALEEAAKVADEARIQHERAYFKNAVWLDAQLAQHAMDIAAAIRKLKGPAKPKPVPSLGKLFDDLATKQRLIGEEFEKFMTDVEDTTEADDEGAIRKLKEKP